MKLLEHSPPATREPLPPPTEVIIPEARKRGRRRRLWIGILVAVALAATGALGGVIGNGGSRVHRPVHGGGPQDEAVSSSHLYTVTNSMAWTGFGLVTASTRALYALGVATSLMRVQIHPLGVTAKISLSGFPDSPFDVNVAAYGLGALWAAAGDLVRLNPTTLAVTARFALPEQALVVLVAGGTLWVGTPTSLLAVDPATGAVVHVDPLGYRPAAIAVSPNGRTLYVLGDKQGAANPAAVLSSFDPATGKQLGERTLGAWSAVDGLAAAKGGAWVSLMDLNRKTPTGTILLYRGSRLARGPRIHLPTQGAVTVAYVADQVLWLIDGRGTTRTECVSPKTGRFRATGSAGVTSEDGAMLTVKGHAFLLTQGVPRRLLEIRATSTCTS